VVVGRARPPHAAAAHEYETRVGALVALRVDEVAAEPAAQGPDQVHRREAERILARVIPRAHVVALDPGGRAPASSEAFGAWLAERLSAARPLCLLVGGPAGLPPSVAAGADERLSLGPLTLPHQLARVVLAEQLYRALAGARGHPYPR
jgi:23S rRNA (pseudouridine1915-N3)-methyltransferase